MVIHGWKIYLHQCMQTQLLHLLTDVQRVVERRPEDFRRSNAYKRVAAVANLAFDQIPKDPSDERFRQGNTLGSAHRHWFRAKFFQQYRLFFRYDLEEKVIIYGWVNDDSTLRATESRSDAYAVFAKMLASGQPPSDWKKLRAAVVAEDEAVLLINDMMATRDAL